MWDSLIDSTLRFIQKNGMIAIIALILALMFPVITVIAGTGYGFWWGVFHVVMIFLTIAGVIIGPLWAPREVKIPVWITGVLAVFVLICGIVDYAKPSAVLLGLFLSQIGLFYFMLFGAGIVFTFGVVVAMGDPTLTDAEAHSRGALAQFIGIAAWECLAAWYIVSFGQYLSLYASAFLICAAGVIVYGGIAWGIAGDSGRKIIYYGAVMGVIAVTAQTIYRLLIGEGYINSIALVDIKDFLLKAVNVHGHTFEWFLTIAIVLAVGFIVSQITGMKGFGHAVTLITLVIATIFFLAWLGWFDGTQHLNTSMTKVGKHDLPAHEFWHGTIRALIVFLSSCILAIQFYKKGFIGFTWRLCFMVVFVFTPWLLFETFLWKWMPFVVSKTGAQVDFFISSISFFK